MERGVQLCVGILEPERMTSCPDKSLRREFSQWTLGIIQLNYRIT